MYFILRDIVFVLIFGPISGTLSPKIKPSVVFEFVLEPFFYIMYYK